ncbi:hypothetical protein GCM10010518_07300 [Kitasatospora cinereorecta]
MCAKTAAGQASHPTGQSEQPVGSYVARGGQGVRRVGDAPTTDLTKVEARAAVATVATAVHGWADGRGPVGRSWIDS